MSRDDQRRAEDEGLLRFIRLTFRSVWSVELLLLLRSRPDQVWTRDQLIQSLRASDQVLSRSVDDLAGAGLIHDENGFVHYQPEAAIEETVTALTQLYISRPATVRRLIAGGSADDQLTRFADAFRLRREDK